jgi:anti-sigma regulatory factor (Ser/Thr protein kinase)
MEEQRTESSADLRLEVEGDSKAVSASRRTIQGLDEYVGDRCTEKLRLLVSEVVTNAVIHGGVSAAAGLELKMMVSPSVIRVEVTDRGEGFVTHGGPPGSSREVGGWGLMLVHELADRWGTSRDHGSIVWFELDRDLDGSKPDR